MTIWPLNRFFSYFNLLYNATVDNDARKIEQAAGQLETTFRKMISIFSSYHLDVSKLEELHKDFIKASSVMTML